MALVKHVCTARPLLNLMKTLILTVFVPVRQPDPLGPRGVEEMARKTAAVVGCGTAAAGHELGAQRLPTPRVRTVVQGTADE